MGLAATQNTDDLQSIIEKAWDNASELSETTQGDVRDAVETALALLDAGEARVAEKIDGKWEVHQWLKKAVLLSFRLNPMQKISGGPNQSSWYDKVESKFHELRGPSCILYWQGRGFDAIIREYWCLCRRRHDGRYMGDGWVMRANRQERTFIRRCWYWRRVGAFTGEPNNYRR